MNPDTQADQFPGPRRRAYADLPTPDWEPATTPPALAPGDLHLWWVETAGPCPSPWHWPWEEQLALLDPVQAGRAARMAHEGHRRRWVQAQAGLRRILAGYLGRAPGALTFVRGPAGKPALHPGECGAGALEFNLTTTGDLALVAVSGGLAVGVDCEWLRPRHDLLAIARRMFPAESAARLAALPDGERQVAFHRAWTALEADAKWDGRGLFRPREPGAPVPRIEHFVPAAGYVGAVARSALPPPQHWRSLRLSAGASG
jgi:4'-phosphopantetheinyl transferase